MSKPSSAAPRKRFSKWFEATRTALGITPAAAARALKVHPSAVMRWEQGEALPVSPLLQRIRDWSGISAEQLLTMLSEDNV